MWLTFFVLPMKITTPRQCFSKGLTNQISAPQTGILFIHVSRLAAFSLYSKWVHSFVCSICTSSISLLVYLTMLSLFIEVPLFSFCECLSVSMYYHSDTLTWFWALPFVMIKSTSRLRNMRDWYTYSWCSISFFIAFESRIISCSQQKVLIK